MPLPDIPTGIQTKADQILQGVVDSLALAQPTYLQANGRYWQGLSVTPSIPTDGTKSNVDASKLAGTHTKSWQDLGITLPAQSEIAIEVHEYNAPQGKGYAAIGSIVIAGKQFARTVNVGPETYRDTKGDWIDVTPPANIKGTV